MRKVEFDYLEVLNETEQLMVFTIVFDKKEYGQTLLLNTALPIEVQDIRIRKTVTFLSDITRKRLKLAETENENT